MENTHTPFDPESWTLEELVKHLYRDMQDVKHTQSRMMTEIHNLKDESLKRRSQLKAITAAAAGAGAFIGWISNIVLKLIVLK